MFLCTYFNILIGTMWKFSAELLGNGITYMYCAIDIHNLCFGQWRNCFNVDATDKEKLNSLENIWVTTDIKETNVNMYLGSCKYWWIEI